MSSTCASAQASAGSLSGAHSASLASTRAAPSSRLWVSSPASSAMNRPTGDSTENRPPTPGGTGKVAKPSSSHSLRKWPDCGSVVTVKRLRASLSLPTARLTAS